MKKYLLTILLLVCASSHAQSVITNWVYQNTYITNNIYMVSNITYNTYEEHQITNIIKQYVYYTYYITNNASYVTNYYYTTNFTYYVTNNIETVINNVTNNIVDYHYPVYYPTYYSTNVYNYIDTYIATNVTVNFITNYTTEITLTNFEAWAEECQIYAYISNESARRLASTNAVAFHTNSYIYVDVNGTAYNNILALSCNNMNGVIQATADTTYASSVYYVKIGTSSAGTEYYCYLSHAESSPAGMRVYYLPTKMSLTHITGGRDYVLECLYWESGWMYANVYSKTSSAEYRETCRLSSSSLSWPSTHNPSSADSVNNCLTMDGTPLGSSMSSYKAYIKTAQNTYTNKVLYVATFPTLDQWKFMWWLTNTTGAQLR